MLGNATVSLVATTTVTDAYGDTTSTTAETPLYGCVFDPGTVQETSNPRIPVLSSKPTLYIMQPTSEVIDADDTVKVNGRRYTVEGEPRPHTSPMTGARAVTAVTLRRWEQL